MAKELKYLGSITSEIVSIDIIGYIAIVKTIETIGPGNSLRIAVRKPGTRTYNAGTKVSTQYKQRNNYVGLYSYNYSINR